MNTKFLLTASSSLRPRPASPHRRFAPSPRLRFAAAALLLAASPTFADTLALTDAGTSNLPPSARAANTTITTDVPAKLIINLNGSATRFTGTLAIDPDSPNGSAAVTITADDRRLTVANPSASAPAPTGRGRGQPPMLTLRSTDKIPLDLDVSNVHILVIETVPAGNTPNTHVDIADAAITYTGTKPAIVPPQKDDPDILTPAPPPGPRIRGPRIFGVRPTHPILFTIPATGDRPMTFSADNLPPGTKLDPATGMLSGSVSSPGQYKITFHAKNAIEENTRDFTLAVGDTIALTPQLGWNSWNCFGSSVTADKVKAAADAMVSSGLINHGFTYINIDDFWEKNARLAGRGDATMTGDPRAADGTILPNARFPDMKSLTDYIHAKGLRAGLYSSPGPTTCGGCTGSYQHEEQDVQSWDKWGFDYIKYDLCSYTSTAEGRANPPGRSAENGKMPYAILGEALKKTDRDIFYSLCQYGQSDVGEWAPSIGGNSWRTTGDISGRWSSLTNIIDLQVGREKYAGPGHWNDPDMLVVGKTAIGNGRNPTAGLTPNEMTTHISMWCLLDAPLLIGCDMTKMDPFTLSLLTNDEVLDVNQDSLGQQATRIINKDGFQVWAKDLADGSKAVGIFNRTEIESPYTLNFADLKLSGMVTVRDLWRQKDVQDGHTPISDGVIHLPTSIIQSIPRHGVVLLRISHP